MGKKAKVDRRAEILVAGYWKEWPFGEMREGDVFRMFEQDGTPVDDGQICRVDGPIHETVNEHKHTTLGCKVQPLGRNDEVAS